MKIVIVEKQTKRGKRYYAYKSGLLSHLHIFCFLNSVSYSCTTPEECIDDVRDSLVPDPPPNTKIIKAVEI